MLWAAGVGGDERQVDFRFQRAGQLDLGALGGVAEALEGHAVLGQVDPGFGAKLRDQPVQNGFVEVIAAEVGVPVGGQYFEHPGAEVEDGDVEGAAAEVEHRDLGVGLLPVDAVSQRGGGGFVDDSLDVQTGDLAGVHGGLALGVIEVGRDRDDGLGDPLAELGLSVPGGSSAGSCWRSGGARSSGRPSRRERRRCRPGGDGVGQASGGVLDLGVGETPTHEVASRRRWCCPGW